MKKVLLLFGIVLTIVILVGADIRQKKEASSQITEQKPCYGYTIIQFGTGIDCSGDTVKLVKVPGGGQQLARVD